MEGKLFGDVPLDLELRLSVEDSPNSAGVAIDSIRCAKLALDRGEGGVLAAPSAYFCKHPPQQLTDDEAFHMMENFIHKCQDKVREISDYQQREGHQISTKK
jgi:myo-inositol-1-phosphate synthase